MAPKRIVRLATVNDYEDVMNINKNIYDGLDYLPAKYFEYIEDPRYLLFVTEIDKKVVSFGGIEIINHGTDILSFGGRTHIDYQHQGIGEHQRQNMYKIIQRKIPEITNEATTAVYGKYFKSVLKTDENIKMTLMWTINGIECTKSMIREKFQYLKPKAHQPFPKRPTLSEISRLLQSPEAKKKVFGDQQWFTYDNYWCPLLVNDYNLKIAAQRSNVLVALSPNNEIEALSFDSAIQVAFGIRVDVWFYGGNTTMLLIHLHSILKHLLQVLPDKNICIFLAFPKSFDRQHVVSKLEPNFGKESQRYPSKEGYAISMYNPISKL